MRIGFLIVSHQKPEQLMILLQQLLTLSEENMIFVHINKKYEEINKSFFERNNDPVLSDRRIVFLDKTYAIDWGKDGLLKAQMALLEEARSYYMDYFIYLTGQDMMIKKDLQTFIEENNSKTYIEYDKLPECGLFKYKPTYSRQNELLIPGKVKMEYYWPPELINEFGTKANLNRIRRRLRIELYKRGFPGKKKKVNYIPPRYWYSYFWIAFPDKVADVLLKEWNNKEHREIWLGSLVPEENYFATVIMNSPEINKEEIINHDLVYLNKIEGSNHVKTNTYKDIPQIESCDKEKYFSRKFDLGIDKKIVEHYLHMFTN